MDNHLKQAEQNSDLVSGWRLSVTMQLRTPLKYLELHGMRIAIEDGPPPEVPAQHGSWVVTLKSFTELGIPLPEIQRDHVMASEIGPVPADGGPFLDFAKAVRRAIEEPEDIEQKLSSLRSIVADKQWMKLVKQLGGTDAVISRFFKKKSASGRLVAIYETD